MDVIATKLTFNFSVHATEDFEKNMKALGVLTTGVNQNQAKIYETSIEGGYSNPIKFLEVSFTKNTEIEKIFNNLSSRLSDKEKEYLSLEFDNRFDIKKKNFFIRFDKSSAYNNELRITDSANVIKLIIRLRAFTKTVEFKDYLKEKGIIK